MKIRPLYDRILINIVSPEDVRQTLRLRRAYVESRPRRSNLALLLGDSVTDSNAHS
jgi:hypothetical protein